MTTTKMPKRLHALLWLICLGIVYDIYYFSNSALSSSAKPLPTPLEFTQRMVVFLITLITVKLIWDGRRWGWVLSAALCVFAPFGGALVVQIIYLHPVLESTDFAAHLVEKLGLAQSEQRRAFVWLTHAAMVLVTCLSIAISCWILFPKKTLAYFGFEKMPMREMKLAAIVGVLLTVSMLPVAYEQRDSFRERLLQDSFATSPANNGVR
jgi:hypothetical protein